MNNYTEYLTSIALLLALVLLAGCGGGGGAAELVGQAGPGMEDAADSPLAATPETAGLGGLPQDAWVDPAEIIARRGSELTERTLPGDEYFAKADNAAAGSGITMLYPADNAAGSWVMYSFDNLVAADYPIKVSVEFKGEAFVPESCYLGLSDYGSDSWDWETVEVPGEGITAYLPEDGSAISPGGNLYVVVMALGGVPAAISQIGIELETDDPPPPVWQSVSQGASTDQISLAWADPAETYPGLDYTGVLVERAAGRTGPWAQLAELPAGTTEYDDTLDMEPGLKWYYRLRTVAADSTGWAGHLGCGWVTVDDVAVLHASEGEWSRVRLTWAPVDHADGYLIEYMRGELSGEPDTWTPLATVDAAATTSFEHSGTYPSGKTATAGTLYRYRVWALVDGTPSLGAPVDTGEYVSFGPLTLYVTSNPAMVKLSWGTHGYAGYRLEYIGVSADPPQWTLLAELDGTTATLEHTGDWPEGRGSEYGVEYQYRVRAYSDDGLVMEWSPVVSGRRGVPDVDGNRVNPTGSQLELSWRGIDGIDGYEVEYKDAAEVDPPDWTALAAGPVEDFAQPYGATGYNHRWDSPVGNEARPGITYSYRVRAYFDDEYSLEWTELGNGTRLELGNLYSFSASENSATAVVFDVRAYNYIEGILIEYRNLDGGDPADWTLLQTTDDDHTATSPVGKECAPDTNYEYRAKGTAGDNLSPDWLSDTGRRGLVTVPGFSATDGWYADRVAITWGMVLDVDGYRIEYRDTAGASPVDWTLLTEPAGAETVSFAHTTTAPEGLEAQPGITYEYRIKARLDTELSLEWAEDLGSLQNGTPRWPMYGGDARHTWRSDFVGPETPVVLWTHASQDIEPVVGNGGTVYFLGPSDLTAVDRDGDEVWTHDIDRESALLSDGALVNVDGPLSALGPDGEILWEHLGRYANYLTIGTGSQLLTSYRSGGECTVQVFAADGMFRWDYELTATSISHLAQGPEGNIYVSAGSDLIALDTAGNLLWTYPTGGTYTQTPAVADDGTVYVLANIDSTSRLHAVHADGSEYWHFDFNWVVSEACVAIAADGTLYVRVASMLYAITPGGVEDWSLPIQGLGSGPLLIDSAGTIYANSTTCDLYAIYPGGTIKWTLQLSSSTSWSGYGVVPGDDGLLYAVNENDDGDLTLFAIGEAG